MSRELKLIKSETEYEAALAELEALIDAHPAEGTPEADRLELLSLLVGKYEEEQFPTELPDPIEAIRLVMEERGLVQRDLIPYIGSRSKVSEVLNGRRDLSLPMMRAIGKALDIPAEVFLQEPHAELPQEGEIDWRRFPVSEMKRRGWFKGLTRSHPDDPERAMRGFLSPLGGIGHALAFPGQTRHFRTARPVDFYAVCAWAARVQIRALAGTPHRQYDPDKFTLQRLREVMLLSSHKDGPKRARNYLADHGIALIIERHLPGAALDGTAIMTGPHVPVIGLTLRHDRLDNFWFTLTHELVHIVKHNLQPGESVFDDLDVTEDRDPCEREADAVAAELLLPHQKWITSEAARSRTEEAVLALADQLQIHPAIVAGRVQHEAKNYRILNHLVGRGEVRSQFPEVCWTEAKESMQASAG